MKKPMAAYVKEWQSQGNFSLELFNKQVQQYTLSSLPVSHSVSLASGLVWFFYFFKSQWLTMAAVWRRKL